MQYCLSMLQECFRRRLISYRLSVRYAHHHSDSGCNTVKKRLGRGRRRRKNHRRRRVEATAYQQLVRDLQSGADQTRIQDDIQGLASASIQNGDFGLAQVAIDIGNAEKGDSLDPNAALKTLSGATPGTEAAHLPPLPALTS
jgi:hypothetical protein